VLQPQTILGSYRIVRFLGAGGMGSVYEAEHTAMGTLHALKVLGHQFTHSPLVRERFRREAQLMFKLGNHPHIVRATDLIETPEALALVIDLIDGGDLGAALDARPGPLPWAETWRILEPVVAAVAHAHKNNVVHRDLKPENVLLRRDGSWPGVPMVTDFGIAKVVGSEGATRTQSKMGTACYGAPEQFKNAKDVGPEADVWALGMLVWRLVMGRLPIDPDDTRALLMMYEGLEPVARLTGVPGQVADAVAAALNVVPKQRPRDAGVLGKLLGSAVTGATPPEVAGLPGGWPLWMVDCPDATNLTADDIAALFQQKVDGPRGLHLMPAQAVAPEIAPLLRQQARTGGLVLLLRGPVSAVLTVLPQLPSQLLLLWVLVEDDTAASNLSSSASQVPFPLSAVVSSAVTDKGIAQLARLNRLQGVVMDSAEVTDAGLDHLSRLHELVVLDVTDTKVTDAAMVHLARLGKLRMLDLKGTAVTDTGLAQVAKLKTLGSLGLGRSQVTDTGLAYVATMPELVILGLSGTKVTDAGLSRLTALSNLATLDLRGCTMVSEAAIRRLQEALPSCQILVEDTEPASTKLAPKSKNSSDWLLELLVGYAGYGFLGWLTWKLLKWLFS
jgi:serine/threonine protein kinase